MLGGKAFRRALRYRMVYLLVHSLIWASAVFPRRAWLGICGVLGSIAWRFANETRTLTLRHLRMAFPEKSPEEIKDLGRRTFRMLGKNAGDILRSSRVKDLRGLEKFLRTEGLENYEVAHAKGKGVIFLTCHLGAFDLQITNMATKIIFIVNLR